MTTDKKRVYTHEQSVLMYLNHMMIEVGSERRFADAHDAFKEFQHNVAIQYHSDEAMFAELLPGVAKHDGDRMKAIMEHIENRAAAQAKIYLAFEEGEFIAVDRIAKEKP